MLLAVLLDLMVLAVVHTLVRASSESALAAIVVVGLAVVVLVVLVRVLPRHSRTHRVLLVDDARRALRRARAATAIS